MGISFPVRAAQRPYRLPDLGEKFRERVIWGAECESPDGFAVAFGGQDQQSPDGRPHTRIKRDGRWVAIHEELRKKNPWQSSHQRAVEAAGLLDEMLAIARNAYFAQSDVKERRRRLDARLAPKQAAYQQAIRRLSDSFPRETIGSGDAVLGAFGRVASPLRRLSADDTPAAGDWGTILADLLKARSVLRDTIDRLDAEPPPRALSPIVYEPNSGQFILFGGDHLDYLSNDLWAFDPRKLQWRNPRPPKSPPPRANHQLRATGDGKIVLTGGYAYSSSTDYVGGQYVDLSDGTWVYDPAENRWTGGEKLVPSSTRTYRTGPFHPDFYYTKLPVHDAAKHAARLAKVPANTWVKMDPPRLPRLNRDWGTAVIDTDRDLMLRFSGGHSAHGGSDVLHYHFATNRWELCFPVEFPLGQLYANTRYPNGLNFNRRPWVTGHTYQNYGYDPVSRKMLFAGRPTHTYVYDPDRGDWTGRSVKPAGMRYNSCFYTLTLCTTPGGLYCWTKDGAVFRYDAGQQQWQPFETEGRLPGAVVDRSTMFYDSRRDRLIVATKPYSEKQPYDGQLHALDLKSRRAAALSPGGAAGMAAVHFLREIRYDAANDVALVGALLPADGDQPRRTPAYDCGANRWVSLRIAGEDPHGKTGRNVSLGLMYDAGRKLFWAVDTNSQVYALRLDVKTADPRPL